MNKFLPYIFVGLVIVLAIVFFPVKKERRFVSELTLNPKDKIPYGANVSYSLLPRVFPSAKVTIDRSEPGYWTNLDADTDKQVLIIVAKKFAPTEDELDKIISFAQNGNYVFISTLQYGHLAKQVFKIDQAFITTEIDNQQVKNVTDLDSFCVKLDSGLFHNPLQYYAPGTAYDNFFVDYDKKITYPLGYSENDKPNLLAIKTMKGTIYLHSAPIAFTNFFLLYNNNHAYFENMAALIPIKPTKVVWDEYYLFSRNTNTDDNKQGVLHVLLSYENFRWAFWLTLVVLGLYMLTEIKRRQRQIPEYSKPANEHMEFISTVGKLYYEKGDHLNLANKMTQFFLEHVRHKYKISTSFINADFAKTLSIKTGIPQREADEITASIQQVQIGSISANDLTNFYNHLENFYKKA